MAKRRRIVKARTRTVYRKAPKRRRSSSNSGKVQAVQFDAMIYGAGRQYVSNLITPLTSMIPLGAVSDELGMGIVNYMLAKNMKGMIKKVAMKGLIIENARIGQTIVTVSYTHLTLPTNREV